MRYSHTSGYKFILVQNNNPDRFSSDFLEVASMVIIISCILIWFIPFCLTKDLLQKRMWCQAKATLTPPLSLEFGKMLFRHPRSLFLPDTHLPLFMSHSVNLSWLFYQQLASAWSSARHYRNDRSATIVNLKRMSVSDPEMGLAFWTKDSPTLAQRPSL